MFKQIRPSKILFFLKKYHWAIFESQNGWCFIMEFVSTATNSGFFYYVSTSGVFCSLLSCFFPKQMCEADSSCDPVSGFQRSNLLDEVKLPFSFYGFSFRFDCGLWIFESISKNFWGFFKKSFSEQLCYCYSK